MTEPTVTSIGYIVTIDPGPSNDASRDIGYTLRVWDDDESNLVMSTGSQSYANRGEVVDLARTLFGVGADPVPATARPVTLIVRDVSGRTVHTERLR